MKSDNITNNSLLVAMDMGSHSFRAMAAEMTDTGALRVLGVEESSQKSCVTRGVVDNTTDAGFMLNNVLRLLGNRIRANSLHSTFVCIGGRTVKIYPVSSTRDQVRKREVSQSLLDEMEAECRNKIEDKYPGVKVLDVIPYYYTLDGVEQDYPPLPDQRAMMVESHFMAFVGRKEEAERVDSSFKRSTISVEHAYVRPDALMNALASDDDMERGCAVLDLGAQTTTLTVFKGTQYLHNQVVALGSHDITEAIASLGLQMHYAEHLKCTYGMASPDQVVSNRRYVLKGVDGEAVAITTRELAQIIREQIDQILKPLMETLNKDAGRLKVLYITGGGSMLQGIDSYIQRLTSVPVSYGSHACWLTADTPDECCMPKYASLVGTLLLGAAYREKHPQVKSYEKNKRIIETLKDTTLKLFSDQDDF